MFALVFMRNAYLASTFIALTCGVIGVFVVARNLSFLSHTLSEIGFAGAAFGVFSGLSALNGMLIFTSLSSLIVGALGVEKSRREATISAVSSLFIGLGILFLSLSSKNASYATNILFGSIVGISFDEVKQLIILSALVMLFVLMMWRSLVFDSFDSVGAASQNIHRDLISIIFLILLAFAVSIGAQIVGSLLVFILLTLPAASAQYLGRTVPQLLMIAIGISLIGVWLGLYLGYVTNWPVTFFIASIEVLIYLLAILYSRLVQRS
ncbi:metal ABC transporter permease [Agrilactobacillus fermenti]|uniref:metal ABC transporter permease n=1 Tax=Agrilactobacillus fermenti TaxID=2586909 RepID=UPI001E319991|nr:metal ABC transporter permease [Agrilactobacillus fermenti]MCD2255474.1 metal ABC transporter permease [Agrilactobacillus fermenti]